jgi:hypothetical protein
MEDPEDEGDAALALGEARSFLRQPPRFSAADAPGLLRSLT